MREGKRVERGGIFWSICVNTSFYFYFFVIFYLFFENKIRIFMILLFKKQF